MLVVVSSLVNSSLYKRLLFCTGTVLYRINVTILPAVTSISLSWSVLSDSVVADRYEVMWQREASLECPDVDEDSATITDGSTTYNITGLKKGSSYSVTVRAINDAGSSEVSNTVTAMTLEAGERDSHYY